MSGIAGIAQSGNHDEVEQMLAKIAHRGKVSQVIDTGSATIGVTWSHDPSEVPGSLETADWQNKGEGIFPFESGERFHLKRDPLGVVPMYYGWKDDGHLCFASEVKGLLGSTREVHELPPGHTFDGRSLEAYYHLPDLPEIDDSPNEIAWELHRKLDTAIEKHAKNGNVGAWLSGGLDSSVMAALARPYSRKFHTFASGMPGSPDLEYARIVADYIQSEHHEIVVQVEDLIQVLPEVIKHLESFDAWLVRSSIMNYLVAGLASDYVLEVFSGEGGDELFAGYDYLKSLDPSGLADELLDITSRLHNTALQRVDRCAAAHGTQAHVCFLDPEVLNFAMRIPTEYKLHNGVEKWILRRAMVGTLPEPVLNRAKSKFWQGAGVEELLAEYAEERISDEEFFQERLLPNGWMINSREELLYYRIFREIFGEFEDLSWMGRTKGSPVQ